MYIAVLVELSRRGVGSAGWLSDASCFAGGSWSGAETSGSPVPCADQPGQLLPVRWPVLGQRSYDHVDLAG